VLFDAKDVPGAVEEFKRELDEGHDRVLAMLQIAATEYKIDSTAGLPYAQQAAALAPQLPFAHYLLGLLLADTGADEKAIPELEIAHKAFPQDTRVDWSLAAAYAHVGRAKDAADTRAEVARLYRKFGRPDDGTGAGANPAESQDAPINLTDTAEQGPNN
jgi:tetratricopeptide (TPR) repeat protein